MIKTLKIIALVMAVLLSGCSAITGTTTTFKPWRGGDTYKGKGGSVQVHKGIEIWELGEPDSPYKVIGLIVQTKQDGSFEEMLYGEHNRNSIVEIVKKKGGDGVVTVKSEKFISGYSSIPNAPTHASADYSVSSIMAVFKYVNHNKK